MVDKALVFLVGFLCFTQLSISESVHFKNLNRPRRGIVDDAKNLLLKLFRTAQELKDDALNTIKTLVDGLKNSAQQTLQTSSSLIEEQLKKLIEQLDALKRLAAESGVDISKCTNENEATLLALADLTIKELSKCINQQIGEAQTVTDNIVVDISKTLDEVLEIGKEIDKCGIGVGSIVCLTQVFAKISTALTVLPVKIASYVAQAGQVVGTQKNSVAKCAMDATVGFAEDSEKIFMEITNCIQNKLGS